MPIHSPKTATKTVLQKRFLQKKIAGRVAF